MIITPVVPGSVSVWLALFEDGVNANFLSDFWADITSDLWEFNINLWLPAVDFNGI